MAMDEVVMKFFLSWLGLFVMYLLGYFVAMWQGIGCAP